MILVVNIANFTKQPLLIPQSCKDRCLWSSSPEFLGAQVLVASGIIETIGQTYPGNGPGSRLLIPSVNQKIKEQHQGMRSSTREIAIKAAGGWDPLILVASISILSGWQP